MISIKKVLFRYRDGFRLQIPCLDFCEGRFIGIIGPNGAGKSTLMKLITRILDPQEGVIEFNGKDIHKIDLSDYTKQVTGIFPIESTYFQDFIVEDFLLLGRLPFRHKLQFFPNENDWGIVISSMEQTDLLRFSKRRICELSMGEIQMVLITRALVQGVDVIVLDEPVAHLDIKHQIEVSKLLKRLAETGKTVISSFHNINLASEFCDELIVMKGGEVLCCGIPEEVVNSQMIETVYEKEVCIVSNPVSGKPNVLPKV